MISAPEDYGLTAKQTLGHRCVSSPPEGFDDFWRDFRDEVAALGRRVDWPEEPGQHEVEFRSIREIRVLARITNPTERAIGAVLTTHGYATEDVFPSECHAWSGPPLVVIELRVRGFPPSVRDTGDLRSEWITHNIQDPHAWIVRGAVADVVQVARCTRDRLPSASMLTLDGESLGGGLAVLAASQLAGMDEPVDRLVLGLPTFGDWAWRAEHYSSGAGALVNHLLDLHRGPDRDAILQQLLLFDAALHARSIKCPVLCKLAELDDVVPAPSAAAVFNDLLTAAHLKMLHTTRYGHFDGGLADLRRHAQFERIRKRFADPRVDPGDLVEELRHVQTAAEQ